LGENIKRGKNVNEKRRERKKGKRANLCLKSRDKQKLGIRIRYLLIAGRGKTFS
jgi:hypothetical protein